MSLPIPLRVAAGLAGSFGTAAVAGLIGVAAMSAHPARPAPIANAAAPAAAAVDASSAALLTGDSSAAGGVELMASYRTAPSMVFDNWNRDGVSNGTTAPVVFSLPGRTHITELATYHWNNGAGAVPRAIWLLDSSGHVVAGGYVPGAATGAPRTDWVTMVSVDVGPGRYSVTDSDPSTWSQNYRSHGQGFTRVWGQSISTSVPSTPRVPTRPYTPPTPPAPTPHFHGCGYTYTVALMDTCTASSGSTVMFELTRNLPAPVTQVVLTQADNPSLRPTNAVRVTVTGSGTTAGSVYSFVAPSTLCFAGKYSRWHVMPAPASGSGYGYIGDIAFTC